jgi:membrane protease YdiL (CAAX protease family)
MKKIIRHILILVILVFLPAFIQNIYADQPPDPGGGPGGGDPVGGGSPIGGGSLVMILLGFFYGSKKVLDTRKKLME